VGKEGGGVDCSEIVAMSGWEKRKREQVWVVVRL